MGQVMNVLPIVTPIGIALIGSVLGYFVLRWLKNRGKVSFTILKQDYALRGKWSDDGSTPILAPPRFLEFKLGLAVHNSADIEATLTLRFVHLSGEAPVFEEKQTTYPGASVECMGFKIQGTEVKDEKLIRIPGRGMASGIVVGTASTPVVFPEQMMNWRYLTLVFLLPNGKDYPLVLKVDQNDVRLDEDLEPSFPIPPHYIQSQSADLGPFAKR
jgi:hypothetical protein